MDNTLEFPNREAFRQWLEENAPSKEGVWLLFGKKGGPKTLTATEALEEALCYGWIDGQMQSLDEQKYIKYFASRTANSKWSAKNKKTAQALLAAGRMAPRGMEAIDTAKKNGKWDAAASRKTIDEDELEAFRQLVQPHEPAYSNLLAMAPSVQKNYTGFYLDAKSEKTRESRLAKIIDRLNQNLKPM